MLFARLTACTTPTFLIPLFLAFFRVYVADLFPALHSFQFFIIVKFTPSDFAADVRLATRWANHVSSLHERLPRENLS
jgi:hypothetical protein